MSGGLAQGGRGENQQQQPQQHQHRQKSGGGHNPEEVWPQIVGTPLPGFIGVCRVWGSGLSVGFFGVQKIWPKH